MRREWLMLLVSLALLAIGLGRLAGPRPAAAAACVWTGAVGRDWGTAGNWSACNGQSPGSTDSVTIGSAVNQPTISGASVTILSLALTSGATLTIAGDGALTVNGDIAMSADGGATTTIDNAGTLTATAGAFTTNRSNSSGTAQLVIGSSGTWTLQDVTTNTNTDLTIVDGPTIHIRGNVSRGGTLDPGTSTIVFDSGGTQALSGESDYHFYNLEISSGTTINHSSGGAALRVRNTFTNNGTLSQTATSKYRRLQFDYNASYSSSNLNGTGTTTVARIVIGNSKTVNAGSHSITINNSGGPDRTPWDNSGTFNGDNATVTFSGTATDMMTGVGTNNFNNVVITGLLNAGSASLNVAGNWTNNGTFGAGTSTVTFNGGGTSSYGGSSTTTFNNLTINLGTTLDVGTNSLFNVAGTLTNNGTLRQTQTVSGGTVSFLNVTDGAGTDRYYGVDITTSNNLGSTTVAVSGNQQCSQANGYPVQRCFEISPATAASADVTFYFREAELQTGQTLASLKVWHYNGSTWNEVTKGTTGGSGEGMYVQGTGITSFSPFTLKNNDPLAVTVEALTATVQEGYVLLAWETVSELDLQGFNLYRAESPEGPWTRLNPVLIGSRTPGSSQGNRYRWEDHGVSLGVAYGYRLEAISLDGSASTGGIIEVVVRPSLRLWLPVLWR